MAKQNLARIKKKHPKTGDLQQGICALFWSHSKTRKGFAFFPPVVTKMVRMLVAQHRLVRSQGQRAQNNFNRRFSFLLVSVPGHCFQYLFFLIKKEVCLNLSFCNAQHRQKCLTLWSCCNSVLMSSKYKKFPCRNLTCVSWFRLRYS